VAVQHRVVVLAGFVACFSVGGVVMARCEVLPEAAERWAGSWKMMRQPRLLAEGSSAPTKVGLAFRHRACQQIRRPHPHAPGVLELLP